MGGYGTNAVVFLLETIFDLYLITVMLRFLLQTVRASFYNPISQFLVKVTNPPLVPLRRIIPGFMGIDMAAVLLMVVIKGLEIFLITAVQGVSLSFSGLLLITLAELLSLAIYVFIFSILIQVILSWVNPGGGGMNPAVALLHYLNEPLLGRARRLIKPIHGFDFAPIVVLVFLQLLLMLFVSPLSDLGRSLI